jgi:hypothetical protein
MLLEINSILQLSIEQGFPKSLVIGKKYKGAKKGYGLYPIDDPIDLVDDNWICKCQVIIKRVVLEANMTQLEFTVYRFYPSSKLVKDPIQEVIETYSEID